MYNGSVGGTYDVMLKFTEQEIRDHIRRYGINLAGDAIKEVAKDMVTDMVKQKVPTFEMPNGNVLYIQYNRKSDVLEAGQITDTGLSIRHSFPYDHNASLDANLEQANEKLNEMEEYREELQETEYGRGMHR